MNNEQNNMGFNNNQVNNGIPGANIAPVSGINPEPLNQTNNVMPGMGGAMPVENNMVQNNAVMPEMVVTPMDSNMGQNNNINETVNVNNVSPFDIGLNANVNQTEVVNNVNVPVNEVNSQAINNNQTMNNNQSINDKPLTNENYNKQEDAVSVGKYMLHMFLTSLPMVGIIILIVRACSSKENKNISNLAKAQLLFSVIMVVLSTLLMIVFGASIAAIMTSAY